MALVQCDTCGVYGPDGTTKGRKQYNFIGSCTGHSDWPVKGFKPRVSIDVIIPTYKEVPIPTGAMPLDLSMDRARIHKRLDQMDKESRYLILDDIDLGAFPTEVIKEGLHCRFCGTSVDLMTATEGTMKPRMIIKDLLIKTEDEILWDEKRVFISEKALACPDCIGHLDKIKFPEFD